MLGLQAVASTLLDALHWLAVSAVCVPVAMGIGIIFQRKLPSRPAIVALALFIVFVAGSALLAGAHGYAGRIPQFSGFVPALFGLFFYFYADRRYLSARGRWLGLLFTVTAIGAIGKSTNTQSTAHLSSLLVQSFVFAGDVLAVLVVCSGLIPQVYARIKQPQPPSMRSRPPRLTRTGGAVALSFLLLLIAVAISPPDNATPVPPVALLVVRAAILTLVALLPVVAAFALARGLRYDGAALVRRATIYGALIVALAIIYAAGFIAIHLLYTLLFALPPSFELDLAAPFLTLMALLLIAVYRPLRPWVQEMFDRRYFQRAHIATTTLAEFQTALSEPRPLPELRDLLADTVRRVLGPDLVLLWQHVSPAWTARLAEPGTAATFSERLLIRLVDECGPNATYLLELPHYTDEAPVTTPPDTTAALAISADDPFGDALAADVGTVALDELPSRSAAGRVLLTAGATLALPFVRPAGPVGLLAVGARVDGTAYTFDDRQFLDTFADLATPALYDARARQARETTERERERVNQELRTAQRIQQALLPRDTPDIAGWRINTYYQPARVVGGDFYDFLPLSDGRLGLVIGDVSGKGIPAALVMATTRSMLRAVAETPEHANAPGAVLRRVNQLLCGDLPGNMFVTCFYGLLDPVRGALRFANAGQDLPTLRQHDGNVCELRATGMPLGLMPESEYEERDAVLAPGASMLLYSDGVIEAHNPRREMFGFPRLTQAIQGEGAPSAEAGAEGETIPALLRDLTAFTGATWEQEDDITLVQIRRLLDAADGGQTSAEATTTIGVRRSQTS